MLPERLSTSLPKVTTNATRSLRPKNYLPTSIEVSYTLHDV